MITEKGLVERLVGEKAMVRIQPNAACESCEARGSCRGESGKPFLIELINDLQAKPGDQVEISMPASSLMKTGMLVYLLPVAALIVGAALGNAYVGPLHMDPDLGSLLGGALGLGLSVAVIKGVDRSARKGTRHQPRMSRILISADPLVPAGDNK